MKRGLLVVLAVAVMSITACSHKDINYANYTSRDEDGLRVVITGDKVFIPLAAVDNTDRGIQIGIVDGDVKDQIYEYKDHNQDEWIIEYYDSGEMDSSMLCRERSVDDWDVDVSGAKLDQSMGSDRSLYTSGQEGIENNSSKVAVSAFYTPDELFELSDDDAAGIQEEIIKASWNEEGTTDGLSDCIILIEDTKIYYNSTDGVLNDVSNDRYCIVDDHTKELFNGILRTYIELGGFD